MNHAPIWPKIVAAMTVTQRQTGTSSGRFLIKLLITGGSESSQFVVAVRSQLDRWKSTKDRTWWDEFNEIVTSTQSLNNMWSVLNSFRRCLVHSSTVLRLEASCSVHYLTTCVNSTWLHVPGIVTCLTWILLWSCLYLRVLLLHRDIRVISQYKFFWEINSSRETWVMAGMPYIAHSPTP